MNILQALSRWLKIITTILVVVLYFILDLSWAAPINQTQAFSLSQTQEPLTSQSLQKVQEASQPKDSLAVGSPFSRALPKTNSNHKCPWHKTLKVAVAQGGNHEDFVKIFRNTIFNLAAWRYINVDSFIQPDFDFTKDDNYQNLALQTQGGCIELINTYYDGQWDESTANEQFSSLVQRVHDKKDVDLIWAFGTLAGKYLSQQDLPIPLMVLHSLDPVASGIVNAGTYSNRPLVHAQKEIERYSSEIKMFHDIFKFKTLGVIADESSILQEEQGISIIQRFAIANQVQLNLCTGPIFKESLKAQQFTLKRCALELAKNSDAVYVLIGNANTDETGHSISPLLDMHIPVFSQTGISEVERGMLLALADDSKQGSGKFAANVTKEIYHGISLQQIPQNHYASLFLTLNLEAAKIIGWEPSFKVLVAVDNVFPSIKMPHNATPNTQLSSTE